MEIVLLVVVVLERVDILRSREWSKVQHCLLEEELFVADHSFDQGTQYYKAAAVVAVEEEGLHQVFLVVIAGLHAGNSDLDVKQPHLEGLLNCLELSGLLTVCHKTVFH